MTSKSNASNWLVGQAFELGGAEKGKEKLEIGNQKLENRIWKKQPGAA
jgi:hypothetical protein